MIQSLRLTNFKNFQDATLTLSKLTLLVGTNDSGKSNLRDAFRFLQGIGRGYTLAEIFGDKWEAGEWQWRGIRGGVREATFRGKRSFALECLFAAPGATQRESFRIEVETGRHRKYPRVVAERLGVEGHNDLMYDTDPSSTQDREQQLVVRLCKPNRAGRPRNISVPDTKPVVGQLSEHAESKRDARVLLAAQWALRAFRSMRFHDFEPEAMRRPSVPGQVVLGDRGENLSSVLQVIWKTQKRAILEWVRQLTPLDVKDFDFVSDQTGKILVTLIEAGGQRTSAYSASDGTLRFLAIIAAMLGPDPARFYFFEELDTGIHPTRLYLLLQLIEQTVARHDIQVVVTTHSSQLLGFLGESAREAATLVYRLPHHGDARLRRILDIPEARQVLATRNMSRLHESGWLENAVAFLEGPKDAEGARA